MDYYTQCCTDLPVASVQWPRLSKTESLSSGARFGLASREMRWDTMPYWARPEARPAKKNRLSAERKTIWVFEWSLNVCVCVGGQYTRLSVIQADSVLDIMTESWQDSKLVSAAEAWRISTRLRVSKHPKAEKLSWTQAAKKKGDRFYCVFIFLSLHKK